MDDNNLKEIFFLLKDNFNFTNLKFKEKNETHT